MKSSDIIEALERFFLDIIGTIIPGFSFLCGIWLILKLPTTLLEISLVPPDNLFESVIILTFSYIAGHFVISLGHVTSTLLFDSIADKLSGFKKFRNKFPHFISNSKLMEEIFVSKTYLEFNNTIKQKYGFDKSISEKSSDVRSLRNIALSTVPVDGHVIHRFMFISLFNMGMSINIICLLVVYVINKIAHIIPNYHCYSYMDLIYLALSILISLMVSFLFLERRYSFYKRAMNTPFSMALMRIKTDLQKGT